MKITTTVTEEKKVVKEIELPHYSKSLSSYYRIGEDESVLSVYACSPEFGRYSSITLSERGASKAILDSAVNGTPITAEQFEEVMKAAIIHMDTVLSTSLTA